MTPFAIAQPGRVSDSYTVAFALVPGDGNGRAHPCADGYSRSAAGR